MQLGYGRDLRGRCETGVAVTLFNMASREEIEMSSSAAAKAVYVGEYTAICRVLNAYKMMVDTRDIGIVPHLLMEGFWESWVTLAASRLVRPEMRVVNVGANFGYYALLFADLVGPKGSVVAFEPNPLVYDMLRKSRAMNGFVHLEPRAEAVGDGSVDKAIFGVPHELSQNAKLIGPGHGTMLGEGNTFVVRAVSLDQCNLGKIDLVFMDAEGSEPFIWDGMRGLVRANPDLVTVLEWSPRRPVGPYADPIGFANDLAADGRKLYVIEPSGEIIGQTPEELLSEQKILPEWEGECMLVVMPS